MALAGGIGGALVKQARTGEGSEVYGSLLGTAMWTMQMGVLGSYVASLAATPPPAPPAGFVFNPLVNTYRTSDDRWVALCMLQPDLYFEGLVKAIGRADMVTDGRFATPAARGAHLTDLVAELEKTFAEQTLVHWRVALATQKGQWDVVQTVNELKDDPQAVVNGFVQWVEYDQGVKLPLIANPVQFDKTPPELKQAPTLRGDTDEVPQGIGMDPTTVALAMRRSTEQVRHGKATIGGRTGRQRHPRWVGRRSCGSRRRPSRHRRGGLAEDERRFRDRRGTLVVADLVRP